MTIKQNAYGQAIISGSEDDYNLTQSRINARKQPPTENQIENKRLFLKGFGIKIHTMPEFVSVAEMDSWGKRQVKDKLGC